MSIISGSVEKKPRLYRIYCVRRFGAEIIEYGLTSSPICVADALKKFSNELSMNNEYA